MFDGEDKNLPPTPKKIADARKKGNIARSQEISTAMGLIFTFVSLRILAPKYLGIVTSFMENMFNFNRFYDFKELNIIKVINEFWYVFILIFLPLVFLLIILNLIVNYIQVGSLFTLDTLKPDINKLNPINGFKRLFSPEKLFELIKSIIKMFIVGYISYKFLYNNLPEILFIKLNSPENYMKIVGKLIYQLGMQILTIYIFIAILDYIYRRYTHNKGLKMSQREVKEEHKQSQGSPLIKQQIGKKRMEMRKKLSLKQVPNASVVVTNPEHIAVALKYNTTMDAPLVVAKGANLIAKQIREIARKNNVPLVENKPLARNLYKNVEINMPVPPELYLAIAKIIVYVSQLKRRR